MSEHEPPAGPTSPSSSLSYIRLMARHPVAANLLMVMMLLSGVWALRELNTQFFPTFQIDIATVMVTWSGASTEDVEELITIPLEQALREVDLLREMTSQSYEGTSVITLEFEEGTDMGLAVDRIKQRVDQVRNLPQNAKEPVIRHIVNYEDIAKVLVTGGGSLDELRPIVNRMEKDLLDRGIDKIFVDGLPQEQIAIEIDPLRLRELGLSMDNVARRISTWSTNAPVGIIGSAETSRQLRFRERRESVLEFAAIPIVADEEGQLVRLGEIAEIQHKPLDGESTIWLRGMPAVQMALHRAENSDSLEAANILHQWLADTRPLLPPGVELVLIDQQWEFIMERINTLVKNAVSGLALVLLVLFFFLRGYVAFWTAVGIPVSFMAALGVLYILGGSINMLSTFGMIMALGIIVDDAIVVGEEAMRQFRKHNQPEAAEKAAKQMLGPVFASSLTTISAFLPLVMIGGITGVLLRSIPIVVICIIVTSLIECFLILPGHLTHTFRRVGDKPPSRMRQALDRGFAFFRDRMFRPTIDSAVNASMTTLAIAVAILLITAGWVGSGRISFEFFPTTEGTRIFANVGFVSGTPSHILQDYLQQAEQSLYEIEKELDEPFIKTAVLHYGALQSSGFNSPADADHLGSINVELLDPDKRSVRNYQIISAWKERLPPVPGRESLAILEPRAGPPGSDLDIRIVGNHMSQVKSAAERLVSVLQSIPGVYGVSDDTPYGKDQMILKLTPTAQALGFSVESISNQLRASYDGILVQEISDGYDDVEVRVSLPQQERFSLASLGELNIVLPNGGVEPLQNLVDANLAQGFETIRHSGGQLAITVKGSVDPAISNTNAIRAEIETTVLPPLSRELGVNFSFEGRQSDQEETLADMKFSLIPALGMIYLVLAWIFRSYLWPLVVMSIIPFGLVGAIWGHVFMGLDLTLLSLMGIFCLAGIVVNNSIILVVFYRNLKAEGLSPREAIVEAACQRLRAVILTSLTTIGGLTPLLFETALSAQFLKPMAAGIAFGLMFATLLVLFLVPALLLTLEEITLRIARKPVQPSGPHRSTAAFTPSGQGTADNG